MRHGDCTTQGFSSTRLQQLSASPALRAHSSGARDKFRELRAPAGVAQSPGETSVASLNAGDAQNWFTQREQNRTSHKPPTKRILLSFLSQHYPTSNREGRFLPVELANLNVASSREAHAGTGESTPTALATIARGRREKRLRRNNGLTRSPPRSRSRPFPPAHSGVPALPSAIEPSSRTPFAAPVKRARHGTVAPSSGDPWH